MRGRRGGKASDSGTRQERPCLVLYGGMGSNPYIGVPLPLSRLIVCPDRLVGKLLPFVPAWRTIRRHELLAIRIERVRRFPLEVVNLAWMDHLKDGSPKTLVFGFLSLRGLTGALEAYGWPFEEFRSGWFRRKRLDG